MIDYSELDTIKLSRVLFCNIAYMKYYDVDTVNDPPVNGGKAVAKIGDALEKYNFHVEEDGFYYGFVETKYTDGYESGKMPKQIHIEQIDKSYKKEDSIDNVTVIFCAKSNIEGKTVIVGWYKNATVYRKRQYEIGHDYNLKARANECFLIPEFNRHFEVSRAKISGEGVGFGQANVWYASGNEQNTLFAKKVLDYIENYTQEIYLDAEKNEKYDYIYEVLNKCFGNNYSGYMKAVWQNNLAKKDFRVWFPKLAKVKDGINLPASFGCINTISDDGSEIIFDDLKNTETEENRVFQYLGISLVFAQESGNGVYIFRGAYIQDQDKTTLNHCVFKRVATKINVIGAPAVDIELLDEIKVDIPVDVLEQEKQAVTLSNDELLNIAKKHQTKNPKQKVVTQSQQYERSPYIAEYAKRIAKGICQLCLRPAPFARKDGTPYLETHHIKWLSEGGEDSIENTIALCPNCHKKMHIVNDTLDVDRLLKRNIEIQFKFNDETLVGRKINHTKYGNGKIISYDGDIATIEFGSKQIKFKLQDCIEKNIIVVL